MNYYAECEKRGGVCDCGDRPCALEEWQEPCPDCVGDPDELILREGENLPDLRIVVCDTCGHTGLVPHVHGNAGEL